MFAPSVLPTPIPDKTWAPPTARVLLCLDLASTIGFACGSPDLLGEAVHGSLTLPNDVNLGRQYGVFSNWLAEAITDYKPTDLVIEAPFLGKSLRAGRKLFALTGIAELIAWRRDLRYLEYASASVRKTFCGSGRAKKPDVIAACERRGFAPRDDNAADAIALLHHAVFVTKPPADFDPHAPVEDLGAHAKACHEIKRPFP